jgi:hypothetical protein
VLAYAAKTGAKRLAMLDTGSALDGRAARAFATGRKTGLPRVSAGTAPADMAGALRRAGGGVMPDLLYVPNAGPSALTQAVASVRAGVTTIGSLQWSGLAQGDLERLDKACFTGPDPVRFNRLSNAYRTQLEEEMGVIAALAVDAVEMAYHLQSNGRSTRKPVEGLLGPTRFQRDGSFERQLAILRIDGGDVVPVL